MIKMYTFSTKLFSYQYRMNLDFPSMTGYILTHSLKSYYVKFCRSCLDLWFSSLNHCFFYRERNSCSTFSWFLFRVQTVKYVPPFWFIGICRAWFTISLKSLLVGECNLQSRRQNKISTKLTWLEKILLNINLFLLNVRWIDAMWLK